MMLKRRRRWFHSSREKVPLVNMSVSGCLGVNRIDLDFGVPNDHVKPPIKRNSVGSGHVSPRRTSDFKNHLDHRFIVFNCKQNLRREKVLRLCWRDPHWIFQHHLGWRVSSSWCWRVFFVFRLVGLRALVVLAKIVVLQQPDPRDRERWNRPCEDQRPKKQLQILLNCEGLKFVSYTSNSQERMINFWRHRILSEIELESQEFPAKSESCHKPNRQWCAVLPTWQYGLWSLAKWMWEINRAKRLSQAPFIFVTARANLYTDQRMPSLSIRATWKHFKTNW